MYEEKTTLQFCSTFKPLQNFSPVSFTASKFTPKKLFKKTKTSPTHLRVVKRTALQCNSNSLNSQENVTQQGFQALSLNNSNITN